MLPITNPALTPKPHTQRISTRILLPFCLIVSTVCLFGLFSQIPFFYPFSVFLVPTPSPTIVSPDVTDEFVPSPTFPSPVSPVSTASPTQLPPPPEAPSKKHRNPFPPVGFEDQRDSITISRAEAVKGAFSHAWNGYRRLAWGMDELKPVSGRSHNWLGLGLTIVDSLDTMLIMGLDEEFRLARDWVANSLSFDKALDVSVFETNIRVTGGLLAAYDLTGDEMFLSKAADIAGRLSWAFNTTSGVARTSVNLRSHASRNPSWTGGKSVLSEFGSLSLEYLYLAHHTGKTWFEAKVNKQHRSIRQAEPDNSMFPIHFNTETSRFSGGTTTWGALGDSFFEYLLKEWLLTGKQDTELRAMYDRATDACLSRMVAESKPSGLLYIAEWNGARQVGKMDELACFAGGMLVLGAQGGNRDRHFSVGEGLTRTCYEMHHRQRTGISPEYVTFRGGQDFVPGASHYLLRPETVESLFVLWRHTHDNKYREWGWELFQSIEAHAKTAHGYSGIRDVNQVPTVKDDQQQSFFLAETLKYLYLLFSPDWLIPSDKYVFNTEAHVLSVF